ncbi:family 16 glycosylhydrolase [Caulobacter segnis]|uniref:family 16 glycosylhydrolase n=1 Tax=Caulobacter segnis TaxID=88688 RepID=UPI0024100501|nr:family 16 glycosylhydrolase [Caulobacter segnis]MDG2520289.1 family 16 glycosylhydrolase [Caulobacter segnis]
MAYAKFGGALAPLSAVAQINLYGSNGVETLIGGIRAEGLWGGNGDTLIGGAGDDTYYLQGAALKIVELPGEGIDTLVAWKSASLLDYTGIENIKVIGDKLFAAGDMFDNVVQGGEGGQQLYGGGGLDYLLGGAGKDVFIVHKGEGSDVIGDFNIAEDKVRLKAGLWDFTQVQTRLSQQGADTWIDLGDGEALILRNVIAASLTQANFQLELDPTHKSIQTFGDEFNGPLSIYHKTFAPGGTWRADYQKAANDITSYSLTGNNEKQIYTSPYFRGHAGDFAETPFVSNADGTLSIWARPSDNPEIFGYGYTSGLITTKGGFSQTYGYFEMRADLPKAAGAWPAFWMLPADGSWPPELDIMEVLGDDTRTYTTAHSSVGGHTQSGQSNYTPATPDGMHTYGALWTPFEIIWYVDNVEVFRSHTPADMNKPMYLIANLALGGWAGAVDAGALPAEMKIDYIRAYALTDETLQSSLSARAEWAERNAIIGGAGDDIYDVTNPDQIIIEAQDGGYDLVNAYVSWTLSDNIEQINLRSGADLSATGNALANFMIGNSGANLLMGMDGDDRLEGRGGNDRLDGGAGNDILVGGAGKDVFVFKAGYGFDTIMDLEPGERIEIHDYARYSAIQVLDGDVYVGFAEGALIRVVGVTEAQVLSALSYV